MSQETVTAEATRNGIVKRKRTTVVSEVATEVVAEREGSEISLRIGPVRGERVDLYRQLLLGSNSGRITLTGPEASHLGHVLLDLSREVS